MRSYLLQLAAAPISGPPLGASIQLRYLIGISVFYHDGVVFLVPNVAPPRFQVQAQG